MEACFVSRYATMFEFGDQSIFHFMFPSILCCDILRVNLELIVYGFTPLTVREAEKWEQYEPVQQKAILYGLPVLAGIFGGLLAKPIANQITNKTLSKFALVGIPALAISMASRRFLNWYPLIYTLRQGENINEEKLTEGYFKSEAIWQAQMTIPIFLGASLGLLVSQKTKKKSMIPIVIGGIMPLLLIDRSGKDYLL